MKLLAGLLSTSIGVRALDSPPRPEIPWDGNDIMFTLEQIQELEDQGLDTSGFLMDSNARKGGKWKGKGKKKQEIVKAISASSRRWFNQDTYSGEGLMIPYQFGSGQFSSSAETTIKTTMDGMTKLMGGCMTFFHDAKNEFPKGYIEFRSDGGGCWSYIGQVSTTGKQTINLSNGCVHQMIIEHEVLHALGMYHEQSRPDRDDAIIIHWDNIISSYHSQYKALTNSQWHNDGVVYDPESVMHYPWYGFITQEANSAGLSTMTDKKTGKPVQKPRQTRMSGRDAIQLQKMYSQYCNELPHAFCKDGAPYLLANKCDGHGDCAFAEDCPNCDDSDEINCDALCHEELKVESNDSIDSNQFLGNYKYMGEVNNAQYWQQTADWSGGQNRFLYRKTTDNYWHFGLNTSGSCLIYGYDPGNSDIGCPHDEGKKWWKDNNGSWQSYPQLTVTQGKLPPPATTTANTLTTAPETNKCATKAGECDPVLELCVDRADTYECVFDTHNCPVAGTSTPETCTQQTCSDKIVLECDDKYCTDNKMAGTYVKRPGHNGRPVYRKRTGNQWRYIFFNGESWELTHKSPTSQADRAFAVCQKTQQLCPSSELGKWYPKKDDLSSSSNKYEADALNMYLGNDKGSTPCDTNNGGCGSHQVCVEIPSSVVPKCIEYSDPCVADPSPCPAKGATCESLGPLEMNTDGSFSVKNGQKLGTVHSWGPSFDMSFDLYLNGAPSFDTSILEVISGDVYSDATTVRKPAVEMLGGTRRLKITCSYYSYTSEELDLASWHKIRLTNNFEADGQLWFRAYINEKECYSYAALYQTYPKMHVYVGKGDAAMAKVMNFQTSTPINNSPTCTFDMKSCPALDKKIKWRGAAGHAVKESSEFKGAVVSIKIKNSIKSFVDIRKNMYTGFMMFGRKLCGDDFLQKVQSGEVKIYLFDREKYNSAIYDVNYTYKREDGNLSAAIVQFRQNAVPNTKLNLMKGLKVDQIHMVVQGLDKVNFGSKDAEKCIAKPQIGVMKDTVSQAGAVDWGKCAAWSKNMATRWPTASDNTL